MNHPTPARARRLLLATLAQSLLSAALLLAAPAAALADAAAFESAFARFQQAGPDNADAVDESAKAFQQLLAADPADPVLRTYAGAATAMRATTTLLPWRKIAHAEDGLALLDKALALLNATHDAPLHRGVPAVLEARLVAANTFLRLPGMFNRGDRGRALLQQVLGSPLLNSAPALFRATVWMRAAQQAEADGQAAQARWLYEQVATAPVPQAEQARARLAKL